MLLMHLSDLHLDTPFTGLGKEMESLQDRLVQAPFDALEKAMAVAINRKVDAVVIAGDVYDSVRQTIYAQYFFIRQLARLEEVNIPVLLVHGNHDFLSTDAPEMNLPKNVYRFNTDEVTHFDIETSSGETARFYGFSYTSRWIKERKATQFSVNPKVTDYTIGIYHGSREGIESDAGNYAPFTVSELLNKQYDYWALGHIHKAHVLQEAPLIQYAGNIQGRHRNETGDKGAYLVTLSKEGETKSEFVSLSDILWQTIEVICQPDWQVTDVVAAINERIQLYEEEGQLKQQSYLLTVYLTHAERLDDELMEQIGRGELMDVFKLSSAKEYFVAITSIRLRQDEKAEPFVYDEALNESYQQAKELLLQKASQIEGLDQVYQNDIMIDWLSDIIEDETFYEEVVQAGSDLMTRLLGMNRKEEDRED
ncbi:metallophosphoesterase family protein [Dolosicoccus paucivorans]|uniref:metallophosphoesterase family protein n=1 Tax=Dolosicoccus paucivorans TaxID=84521 RepID=UPI00088C4FBA|nr:DNA repair exonuclease [Dolosicoccus paucivorans]SDI75101.1 DNA repair exonuclease SbcCD nuclease subunit [Dolosicoccus paucivorans]